MLISRRHFIQTSGLAATAAYAVPGAAQRGAQGDAGTVPEAIRALKPFPGKAVPISDQERLARIDKARRLMADNDIGAIVLLADC